VSFGLSVEQVTRQLVHAKLTSAPAPAVWLQRKCGCNTSEDGHQCEECRGPRLQAKLRIGSAGDASERRADEAADAVVSGRTAAPSVAPAEALAAPAGRAAAPASAHGVDAVLSSPGRRLDEGVRAAMEHGFGHDFSRVRVHDDPGASSSARALNAQAYTVGHHIVFDAGLYAPASRDGRRLIAHELAHTIQQRQAPPSPAPLVQRKPRVVAASADECGKHFARAFDGVLNDKSVRGVPRVYYGDRARTIVLGDLSAGDRVAAGARDGAWRSVCAKREDMPPQIAWVLDEYIDAAARSEPRAAPAATPPPAQAEAAGSHEPGAGERPLAGVPYEKWSDIVEQQYRARGDLVRANAVRGCRTHGADACAWILTASEVHRLYALAQESGGDEAKVRAGLGYAVPALARQLARAAPRLSLVPSPTPVAPPPVASVGPAVTVIGVAALAAVVVLTVYSLSKLTEFEEKLRAQGFVILEDPLALCIGGCHMPNKPSGPEMRMDPSLKPLTPDELEKWLGPEARRGSRQKPGPAQQPAPQPAPAPQRNTGRCPQQKFDALYKDVRNGCDQPRGCTMQGDTCASATAKVAAGYACTSARERLQKECFSPGDPGYEEHMLQIAQAYAALRRCQDVMMAKCT
jgi:hypothetical protein